MKKERKKATKPPAKDSGKRKKPLERRKTKDKQSPELRVLILENIPADAELMERQLQHDQIACQTQRVETRSEFIKALEDFKPDMVLADYSLPKFNAMQALELARNNSPTLPFIVVTGSIGEEVAVECMNKGADDYLLKDRLARLGEAVRHALEKRFLQAEKHAAEEKLRISELLYRTFIDSSTDMTFLKDEKFRHLLANRELCRFYGKPETEVLGRTDFDLMDKKAAATCRQSDQLAQAERKIHVSEETIGHRTFETRKFPVKLTSGRIGVGGYIREISKSKQIEKALRDSEEYYRHLFENSLVGVSQALPDGRLLRANLAYARMYGYASPEEMIAEVTDVGRQLYAEPRDRKTVLATLKAKGIMEPREMHVRRRDGTRFVVLVGAREIRNADGRLVCYQAEHVDVTPLKKAEEALREMNEIFRLFLKHNPIYVFIKDENIRPVYLSDNYEKLLGRPLLEIMGKSMDELFPSELSHAMIEDDKRILREKKTLEFIEELNGRIYSTIKFPIIISGKAKYLAGYTMDITERKQIEKALRESEERFRAQYHGSPIAAFTWQKKGESFVLKDYNDNAERIINDQVKKFIGKTADEMYGSRPEIIQAFHQCFLNKSVLSLETLSEHFIFGRRINLTFAFIPPDLVMVHLEDITERKQAEERINAALHEKEILLKEIHHRVKNNLQVISGLLTLQAAQTNDERLQRMVKESQGRIWTMALIHQTLYQSGNLVDIDMADYIRSLAGNLLSSHAQVAMPPTVSFDLTPLRLAIDKAIPLALIINELMTNAMKHAFPNGRPGEIRIALQECRGTACPAPTYELTITDNGAGLPAGFDPENQKSLGLQLVTMLSKQLGGAVAIKSSGGTSVHIVFTDNEKKE